jgi:hypothetical protein
VKAMANKSDHLKMIQDVVTRLAKNSFALKGWSVTIVSGLLALSTAVADRIAVMIIAIVPLLIFWILDGYYLDQERRFRILYDEVRPREEAEINFLMGPTGATAGWLAAMFSRTILTFYAALLIVTVAMIVLLSRR